MPIFTDGFLVKVAFRTVRDCMEEQLNNVYTRSLILSKCELMVWPSVQGGFIIVHATEDSSHCFSMPVNGCSQLIVDTFLHF
jgi:hypothetical protein